MPFRAMETAGREIRTSDRVFLETPIVISGTGPAAGKFVENTRTVVLSRLGARIISRHTLAPEQVLIIRCLNTGLDTTVRVIGLIMEEERGGHYGVAFLQPDVNVWGIEFPLLDGTENPAARVFLACANCHAQEVVHLDAFELEVFLANTRITRPCRRCRARTLWMRPGTKEKPIPAVKSAPQPQHTIQERKEPRVNIKVAVCIRHPAHRQELATTENVSQGGFRVTTQMDYPLGTVIEVALPYLSGAANVFTPAKIVHKELGVGGKTFAYGVSYVPSPVARSLTGLKITQLKASRDQTS
jgi:hypothetical protein